MTIGVVLGLSSISLGIVEGNLLFKKRTEVFLDNESPEEMIASLISVIKVMMNTNVRGIGVSIPALVDSEEGIVYGSMHGRSDWSPINLKQILEREFGIPVYINKDSNCLVFAESRYGVATSFKNVVYLNMNSSVNCGIILNGSLYTGSSSGAGEFSDLPYLDKTYKDYCTTSFFRKYDTTAYKAFLEAERDDQGALAIWEEFGYHVGSLLKTVLFTYDPEAIVIGGDVGRGYPYFLRTMLKQLSTFPNSEVLDKVKILESRKEDSDIFGAAAFVK